MSDPINPDHYRQGNIECIDAIESATVNKTGIQAACTANIIKYLWRYESKNGLQDVKKARWYLDRLISVLEQQQADTQATDAYSEKPDWKYAPQWAKFVAQDSFGGWHWFENEPNRKELVFQLSTGKFRRALDGEPNKKWRETLQARPVQATELYRYTIEPPIKDDGEDWQINHGFQVEHPPTLDPFDFVIVEFRHGRTEVGLAKRFSWYHSAKYPYLDIIRYKKVPE